jgi:hypothetical protein
MVAHVLDAQNPDVGPSIERRSHWRSGRGQLRVHVMLGMRTNWPAPLFLPCWTCPACEQVEGDAQSIRQPRRGVEGDSPLPVPFEYGDNGLRDPCTLRQLALTQACDHSKVTESFSKGHNVATLFTPIRQTIGSSIAFYRQYSHIGE